MSTPIQVDRRARDKLAEQLRHYASGTISNYTLDDRVPESEDPALDQIFVNGAWPLYDDLHEYKCLGPDRLNPSQKRHFARMILFLKTDLPYRWPITTGLRYLPHLIISVLTFGWFGRFWIKRHWQEGERDVWPFFSSEELEKAKKGFPYPVASS